MTYVEQAVGVPSQKREHMKKPVKGVNPSGLFQFFFLSFFAVSIKHVRLVHKVSSTMTGGKKDITDISIFRQPADDGWRQAFVIPITPSGNWRWFFGRGSELSIAILLDVIMQTEFERVKSPKPGLGTCMISSSGNIFLC